MALDPKQLEEWKQLSTDERLITDRSPSQVEGEEVMWKLADAVPSLIAEVEQLRVERAFAHDCGTNALREAERLHRTVVAILDATRDGLLDGSKNGTLLKRIQTMALGAATATPKP